MRVGRVRCSVTVQWKIRVTGEVRKEPDIGLLVQAVLLLAEDLERAREAGLNMKRDTEERPTG